MLRDNVLWDVISVYSSIRFLLMEQFIFRTANILWLAEGARGLVYANIDVIMQCRNRIVCSIYATDHRLNPRGLKGTKTIHKPQTCIYSQSVNVN